MGIVYIEHFSPEYIEKVMSMYRLLKQNHSYIISQIGFNHDENEVTFTFKKENRDVPKTK